MLNHHPNQQHEALPISLVLIAHNEEKNLPRCLESAKGLVQEIVAVINDCTDNTRKILESYGAIIQESPWEGMTAQKNKALSLATKQWILHLDADEELSPKLASSIRKFIQSYNNKHSSPGAYIARRTWFLGQWINYGDWYPDYTLRLFLRENSEFQGGRDHDKVVIKEANKKLPKLKGDLFHYSFPSLTHLLKKIESFSNEYANKQIQREKTHFSAPCVIFRSIWRFFRAYILKRGFMDGYVGFFIAAQQTFATFYRHTKVYEHNVKDKAPKMEKRDVIN